jgi:SAM-dependent methyltransferase
MNDAELVRSSDAYGTSARLEARIALHAQGETTAEDFHPWLWRVAIDPSPVPPDARVLEVGVGSARMWEALGARVPRGWHLTLTDHSEGMVAAAQTTFERLGRTAVFGLADVQALPFADDSFDLVFANHMLYHAPDLPAAVAELRRVVRPGGRLVAATNGHDHLAEIVALLHEVRTAWPELRVDMPERLSFTLENGADVLGSAFDHVVLHERSADDRLRIVDASVLARYLASMAYAPDDEAAERLVAFLTDRAEVAVSGSGFLVRRSTGVFVSS